MAIPVFPAAMNKLENAVRRLLPKNQFARSVSILVGGTSSAQFLIIMASPVLTRLYTPSDFGILAVFAGLLALLGVIASLRYEIAIPLPKTDQDAANVVALCLLLVGSSAMASGVLVFSIGKFVASNLGAPSLTEHLWILPFGVALSGTYTVFNYWAVRTKDFSTVASTKIRQSLATVGVQLLTFKAGALALLLGQTGGQGVGTLRLAKSALQKDEFRHLSLSGVKEAAVVHRRFPLYSVPAALANTGSKHLLPLALSAFFGAMPAGLFFIAHRIVFLPSSLLGAAISKVYLSEAAEARRQGTLGSLTTQTHDKLAKISMPVAVLVAFVSPEMFFYVFGPDWKQAGEFASYMAPWLYMQFCTSAMTVFLVTGHQHYSLFMQAVLITVQTSSLFIGLQTESILITIQLFSLTSALVYACFLALKLWIAGVALASACRSHFEALQESALPAALLAFASVYSTSAIHFFSAIALSAVFYTWRYYTLFKRLSTM